MGGSYTRHEEKATAQAKHAECADQGYDFEESHSVNPVGGRPDDGTTFTKNRHDKEATRRI